ncbi:hypothetical protein ACUXCC_005530 [Cytobacillus horneckiae]|uniref:hypothetical protein n=1 Tax=Cytobacillus horneckiae TaxID=549687 RepID=UPI0019D1C4D9|nr:hypothetical protein [Cytobacillus horneckiae]MBN6890039.1 hypothetical protein [Cytobacillus horneckiae]
MKLEGYDSTFGLYELRKYATAEADYKMLAEEFEEVEQQLYEDISPTLLGFNGDEGRVYQQSFNTEMTALNIIDTKDSYKRKIDKLKEKYEMFNLSLRILTEEERKVVQDHYCNGNPVQHKKTLSEAEVKLCRWLELEKRLILEERTENYKAELKKKIRNCKVQVGH